jgi:hypothetical protein
VYLDTSALVRMAESNVLHPSDRNQHAGQPVISLCGDPKRIAGLSDLTIIEFHNALASDWRTAGADYNEYDQAWVESAQMKVMGMVANGSLTFRRVPPQAAEQAIALVTLATRDHGNGLRTWDAMHLITAAEWAHELTHKVELWTTDTDFGRFVDLFPHFQQFVQIRNLDD